MRIKALQSYETSATAYQSTQRNIPENLYLYDLCLLYRSCEDPKVYKLCKRNTSFTIQLRILSYPQVKSESHRLQGIRHRISKRHGPTTSLANVGCKKRPISPAGINSEEEEEEEKEKKKKRTRMSRLWWWWWWRRRRRTKTIKMLRWKARLIRT